MTELHVNVDHVATVRQARMTVEPNPLEAVKILSKTPVAGITTHLREDRRHIQDSDIFEIDAFLRDSDLSLTFEMAASDEIRTICLKTAAKLATLVPEKREEVTTEGGMDLKLQRDHLKEFIKPIQANGTQISLFVDPELDQVEYAKEIGADFVELHTGTYANRFLDRISGKIDGSKLKTEGELQRLKEAAQHAHKLGLQVNLGHGLTVDNLPPILDIPNVKELHIGHSIVANSVYYGLEHVVNRFLEVIKSKDLTTSN